MDYRIAAANVDLALKPNEGAALIDLIADWYQYLRLMGYRHEVAERWFASCEAVKVFGAGHLFAGPNTHH